VLGWVYEYYNTKLLFDDLRGKGVTVLVSTQRGCPTSEPVLHALLGRSDAHRQLPPGNSTSKHTGTRVAGRRRGWQQDFTPDERRTDRHARRIARYSRFLYLSSSHLKMKVSRLTSSTRRGTTRHRPKAQWEETFYCTPLRRAGRNGAPRPTFPTREIPSDPFCKQQPLRRRPRHACPSWQRSIWALKGRTRTEG